MEVFACLHSACCKCLPVSGTPRRVSISIVNPRQAGAGRRGRAGAEPVRKNPLAMHQPTSLREKTADRCAVGEAGWTELTARRGGCGSVRAGEDVTYICIDGGSTEKRRYIFPHEQRICIFSYSEDVFFLTQKTRLYFSSQYKEDEFFLIEQRRCNFSYGANKMYLSLRSKEYVFFLTEQRWCRFLHTAEKLSFPPPDGEVVFSSHSKED